MPVPGRPGRGRRDRLSRAVATNPHAATPGAQVVTRQPTGPPREPSGTGIPRDGTPAAIVVTWEEPRRMMGDGPQAGDGRRGSAADAATRPRPPATRGGRTAGPPGGTARRHPVRAPRASRPRGGGVHRRRHGGAASPTGPARGEAAVRPAVWSARGASAWSRAAHGPPAEVALAYQPRGAGGAAGRDAPPAPRARRTAWC